MAFINNSRRRPLKSKLTVILFFLAVLFSSNCNSYYCKDYNIQILPPVDDFYKPVTLELKREKKKQDVTVAFVLDGPSFVNNKILSLFEKEIEELLKNEYNISTPESKILVADWSEGDIKAKLNQLSSDPQVNFIVPLGFLSSYVAMNLSEYKKPVIVPFISKLEKRLHLDKQGKHLANLNYMRFIQEKGTDLEILYRLYDFKHLAVLINENLYDVMPDFKDFIKNDLPDKDFSIQIIPVGNDVNKAISEFNPEIDAVYVTPLLNLDNDQFKQMTGLLAEKKLPSFSYYGAMEIENGILASVTPIYNYDRMAKQTAINIQRILMGEKPEELPTDYKFKNHLRINIETANKIGYKPDWQIRTQAEYVSNDEPITNNILSLDDVIETSVNNNLEIKVKAYDLNTSRKDIHIAKSKFLPSIDLYTGWLKMSSGIQEESMGFLSPHTLFMAPTLSQLIYSDKAFANVKIKKYMYQYEIQNLNSLKQNVATKAAITYLDYLMAKNNLKIERQNIELSRRNLELAQARLDIGYSNPSDVYRFKAEIARNKNGLIKSEASMNAARVNINKILNQPQNEYFKTIEADITDPYLMSNNLQVIKYLQDPLLYEKFVELAVGEGIKNSPEMSALGFLIEAKNREIVGIKREFWTPDINFSLNYLGFTQDNVTQTQGNFGMNVMAQFPIIHGGERIFRLQKAREELLQLKARQDYLQQDIESNIRLALLKTGATYPNIELSKEAALNIHKALDLISDSYKEGTTPVIDLLVAQNQALIADQQKANAVYEFITSLIDFQRALGRSKFDLSDTEWQLWLDKIDKLSTRKENNSF